MNLKWKDKLKIQNTLQTRKEADESKALRNKYILHHAFVRSNIPSQNIEKKINQEHYLVMRGKLLKLVCFSFNKSRQFEDEKVLRNGLVTSFWFLTLLRI